MAEISRAKSNNNNNKVRIKGNIIKHVFEYEQSENN